MLPARLDDMLEAREAREAREQRRPVRLDGLRGRFDRQVVLIFFLERWEQERKEI